MKGTSRFTVSIPAELLEAVDKTLLKNEDSRSALVRRLFEEALSDAQEREDVDRWIQSYKDQPQTEEEFGWSDHVTIEHMKDLPW